MTQWPAQGLAPIWKQPIGQGYASFVVADGRAYTIEQRRGEEVVTAYDVATGREQWKQGWNALYSDSTGDGPRSTPTWDDGRTLCARRYRRTSLPGCKVRRGNLGQEHSQRQPGRKPLLGHGGFTAHRGRQGDCLAGRAGGKSVVAYNKMTGRSGLASTRRRAGLCFSDAGNARRTASDRDCQLVEGHGSGAGRWLAALESSMGHQHGHQCFPTNCREWESVLHFIRLRKRRGAG